jgi:hypothetical protein
MGQANMKTDDALDPADVLIARHARRGHRQDLFRSPHPITLI